MIRCSKCEIEKPLDQYYTYYHSTQQKMRTRKVCKTCFNKKKEPQQINIMPEPVVLEDFTDNPNYKMCRDCYQWKKLEMFYSFIRHDSKSRYYNSYCIECHSLREKKKNDKKTMENGGSPLVLKYPNQYFDEYQKDNTFQLMNLLGYIYNEEHGIWTKPDWKEIRDGKPFFLHIKQRRKYKPKKEVSSEQLETIKTMRDKGKTYKQISLRTGLSLPIVKRHCNE